MASPLIIDLCYSDPEDDQANVSSQQKASVPHSNLDAPTSLKPFIRGFSTSQRDISCRTTGSACVGVRRLSLCPGFRLALQSNPKARALYFILDLDLQHEFQQLWSIDESFEFTLQSKAIVRTHPSAGADQGEMLYYLMVCSAYGGIRYKSARRAARHYISLLRTTPLPFLGLINLDTIDEVTSQFKLPEGSASYRVLHRLRFGRLATTILQIKRPRKSWCSLIECAITHFRPLDCAVATIEHIGRRVCHGTLRAHDVKRQFNSIEELRWSMSSIVSSAVFKNYQCLNAFMEMGV